MGFCSSAAVSRGMDRKLGPLAEALDGLIQEHEVFRFGGNSAASFPPFPPDLRRVPAAG